MGKCRSLQKKKKKKKEEEGKGIFERSKKNLKQPILLLHQGQVHLNNTSLELKILATQTFDNKQTHSTTLINITKTNDAVEHLDVAKNNLSIIEIKRKVVKWPFKFIGKKQKRVYIFSWIPLLFLQLDSK